VPRYPPIMVLLLAIFALAGCTSTPDTSTDGDSGPDPEGLPCSEAPSINIGTGEVDFLPLSEDDPVVMVHGPQGGWHMLTSARVNNTDSIVRLKFTIEVAETGVVFVDNTYTVQMIRDEDCSGFYPGMYGYISYKQLRESEDSRETPPDLLADVPVLIRMSATDLDGLTASASLQVIATPDPVDVKDTDTDTGDTGK
jgi:hypothetical protein